MLFADDFWQVASVVSRFNDLGERKEPQTFTITVMISDGTAS